MFVYGGRGLFDNMRHFALANGFERFVEQKDFKTITHKTIWGVCDEDIFRKSIEEFDRLQTSGRPFFATILTVSNHKPYTFPKGRIDLNPDQHSRDHAVKYADWALGRFFEDARSHPFFKKTVFVVLGDHGARVYGADFIPIESYEIPVLIYSPALVSKSKRVDTLGCSMDVAPTIMGLLGLPYRSVFFGRDLLNLPKEKGYALLQHDRDIGFFDGKRLGLLSTRRFDAVYDFDSKAVQFQKISDPTPAEQDLVTTAVSFYQTAFHLYEAGNYRFFDGTLDAARP
jgi:phosphoglycerol transferase MdoB-like AlkP superfamily enzyme